MAEVQENCWNVRAALHRELAFRSCHIVRLTVHMKADVLRNVTSCSLAKTCVLKEFVGGSGCSETPHTLSVSEDFMMWFFCIGVSVGSRTHEAERTSSVEISMTRVQPPPPQFISQVSFFTSHCCCYYYKRVGRRMNVLR